MFEIDKLTLATFSKLNKIKFSIFERDYTLNLFIQIF